MKRRSHRCRLCLTITVPAIAVVLLSISTLLPRARLVSVIFAQEKGGVIKPNPTPTPRLASRPHPTPTPRLASRPQPARRRVRRRTSNAGKRISSWLANSSTARATDTSMRASDRYESYHTESEGPILDCNETSEEQLELGEYEVEVLPNRCSKWFITNPDAANPTFKHRYGWMNDAKVLVEIQDRGGYGVFTDSPTIYGSSNGDRIHRFRFKGLAEPATVTIRVEVRFVAIVRNDTNGPIPYKILLQGSWESFTISPGHRRSHIWLNPIQCICLKYDHKYEDGYQEKKYSLQATKIIGRDPTESEEEKAKVNYFKVDADGNITLYAAP
ncbi:MAG: hypothetical protein QOG71_2937 [Pyrinomonadaceae bacterium]|nr:hypothetical protein [Pyrinomonadaceae bacterium]